MLRISKDDLEIFCQSFAELQICCIKAVSIFVICEYDKCKIETPKVEKGIQLKPASFAVLSLRIARPWIYFS